MSKKYVMQSVPTINRARSRFDLSHGHKTSASLGYLYPLDPIEVLPGDTFKFNLSAVVRLASTLIRPVMDNIFMDVHYFFVPKRLLYDKFEDMFGTGSPSDWTEPEDVTLPVLGEGSDGDYYGDHKCDADQNGGAAQVAAHMGLPVGQDIGYSWTDDDGNYHTEAPSILPFRAFAMIYNEFFRDENLIDPMNVVKGDTGIYEYLNTNAWSPANYTGCVPKVSKLHDLFTSVLPAPQKGSAVTVPLSLVDDIPVDATDKSHAVTTDKVRYVDKGTGSGAFLDDNTFLGIYSPGPSPFSGDLFSYEVASDLESAFSRRDLSVVKPSNMWAVAGDYQSSLTVNDLRFAFQYQRLLEQQARQGTRFIEWLMASWNVQPGDTRLQRPEYLGGKRLPLNIQQVMQTAGYNADESANTLAQVGGNSQTADGSACSFVKSFSEPGYIIGTFCLRQFHSYSQGVNKMWYKRKRIQFYEPVFANIGEQPVYKYQLFASEDNIGAGANKGNPPIFGYQEAWQEYRQIPNLITGQMSSKASNSLDMWHLGDNYASSPSLGQSWIEEIPDILDDRLTVESSAQDQFIIDFWEGCLAVRCMPVYSVPGLIDHH